MLLFVMHKRTACPRLSKEQLNTYDNQVHSAEAVAHYTTHWDSLNHVGKSFAIQPLKNSTCKEWNISSNGLAVKMAKPVMLFFKVICCATH